MSDRYPLVPPEDIPPLIDPAYDGYGPYSKSELRDVVGTRINPDAVGWYKHKHLLKMPTCPAKTAAHPELEGWLGDVGSFDPRSKVVQPRPSEWQLPIVIPRIKIWGGDLPYPVPRGTYIIDYPTLTSDPTAPPNKEWVFRLQEMFPEGSQLILGFHGSQSGHTARALTLGTWTQRDWWYSPFLENFTGGVVVCDYSPYSDDPKPQTLFGERMMQVFAQEGSDAGKTVIPYIAWSSEENLRRQVELWASQYPRVHTVLVDCCGAGIDPTLWKWRWLYAMEKYFAQLPRGMRFLITGMNTGWVIRELNRIFPARNYSLIPSVSTFVRASGGTTDKDRMARTFRKSIQRLEDFHTGRTVADAEERPDHWPTFAECLKTSESNT